LVNIDVMSHILIALGIFLLLSLLGSCSSSDNNNGWLEIHKPTSEESYTQLEYTEALELSGETFSLASTTKTQCYCYDPTFISCFFGLNSQCVDYSIENRAVVTVENITMNSKGFVLAHGPDWTGATFLQPGENIIQVSSSKSGQSGSDRLTVYAEYDFTNLPVWVKLASTDKTDYGHGVAIDGLENTHIIGSSTDYNEPFESFYSSYDQTGKYIRTYLFRNEERLHYNPAGIASDEKGNVFIVGDIYDMENSYTYTTFIEKHDPEGGLLWSKTISRGEFTRGGNITVDNDGNVYIVGYAVDEHDLDYYAHVYIAKYTGDGSHQWTKAIRSDDARTTRTNDPFPDIAVDGYGNIYITGTTTGNFSCPSLLGIDVYVSKLDSNGNIKWISQFCEDVYNYSQAIAVDKEGNSYITGHRIISGTRRNYDVLLARFDGAGNRTWSKTISLGYVESGTDISIDNDGVIHVVGRKYEDTGGTTIGYEPIDDTLFIGRYNTNGDEVSFKEFLLPESYRARIAMSSSGSYSVLSSVFLSNISSRDIYLSHFK